MTTSHLLGFPRIGAHRELKFALESFWKGTTTEVDLLRVGRELRARHWGLQRQTGLSLVAAGDFAYYDHVHNVTALVGAAPTRFGYSEDVTLAGYFEMARGSAAQPALEMTKWFDTNYHYLVPEFDPDLQFHLNTDWLFPEVEECVALGHRPKVCLLGPLSYLYLGKSKAAGFDRLDLLGRLLGTYREALSRLTALGVEWLQLDEPILALDLPAPWLAAFAPAYRELAQAGPRLLLATYFGDVCRHVDLLKTLPIDGLHLDLVRAPQQLPTFLADWPAGRVLSAGIVDGRNIWRNDLAQSLHALRDAAAQLGERLWLAPSCSLLHVPVTLETETALAPELKHGLAFATEKLTEVVVLAQGLTEGAAAICTELEDSSAAVAARAVAPAANDPAVRARVASLTAADAKRVSPFAERHQRQRAVLGLPEFPTTTIGSFPQTAEIRHARARRRAGQIDEASYVKMMRAEIADCVARQEKLGLDVLVHGEPERNDMVEYFGEQLKGYAFTVNGWVQSYGSRCVKPPVTYGDVSRPQPMTVAWTRYAQSLTDKPVKGMLTGPVTLLQWSFVRDDQPRADTALQLALVIRDEVNDLQAAGVHVIQIDEPAFREGLPLARAQWPAYLEWAVRAFRVAAGSAADDTQIHTHMCYAEFNDILPSIAALDADVITIETSRSDMELLDAFASFKYPNDIGPGIYDIHSPRVPAQEEMTHMLEKAVQVVPPQRLWVNPDCGLKTRAWPETEAALARMVGAAHTLRQRYAVGT